MSFSPLNLLSFLPTVTEPRTYSVWLRTRVRGILMINAKWKVPKDPGPSLPKKRFRSQRRSVDNRPETVGDNVKVGLQL